METTAIATSTYGTVREVEITAKGTVYVASTNVLLGDVEGMERLGWEFTR